MTALVYVGGWSVGVLNGLLVKNSTPSAEQQSLIFFMMHLFAISSWIYYFLFRAYLSTGSWKKNREWNHRLPFRRPAFVYNNKRPVILSFRSFRILGQHWAETILNLSNRNIILLTRYAPKLPLSVMPFMFIVSVQANKGMKVNESRKTSVILFIRERDSRPRI